MGQDAYIFEVTENSFPSTVIENSHKVPVIVEFMAVWSEPCIVVETIFSNLAKEFAEQFIFAKVDIDEQPELRKQYKIENIPTVIVIKNGEVARVDMGQINEDEARAILKETGITPNRVIANGCTFLVYKTSKDFSPYNVPTIVSLNTIMIDGTGMCGVCRVTVDGKMKFACVDGPDFDGRLVDWEELFKRRKQYLNEEAFLVHNSGCGGG